MIFYKKINVNSLKIIILLIFLCSFNSFAYKRLTPFVLKAGAALNGNLYLSDFTQLSGYDNNNEKFSSAFSIGSSIFIGAEYVFESNLFGFKSRADIILSYQDISANYIEEEFLANIITGNSYVKGTVEHRLETTITAFLIEPGIYIYPLNDSPLSIRLGLQFGFPSEMSFYQQEKILSPDWINYKQSGTKIINDAGGEIPNPSSIFTAVSLGMRYEAMELGNLSINPFLRLNLALTNIVSDLDWKTNSIQAGISINFRIPKPKNIPPIDAPLPPLPLPLKAPSLTLAIDLSNGNKKFNNGDTISAIIHERQFVDEFFILPIVFYRYNTDKRIEAANYKLRSEENAQQESYIAVAEYLISNPNVNLTIISSSIDSEIPEIVESRKDKVFQELVRKGVDRNRITVKAKVKRAGLFERQELIDDNCYIKFHFSDGRKMLVFRRDTTRISFLEDIEFQLSSKISAEILPIELNGEIIVDNKKAIEFNQTDFSFSLRELLKNDEINAEKITIKASVRDTIEKEAIAELTLNIKSLFQIDGIFENVISDKEQTNYVQQLLLAYCEFDKADLYAINTNAVNLIKEKYKEGNIIEIIPLFDFLGSDEHNLALAYARANSALKLLGIEKHNVQITIPQDFFFSNELPFGRMLNRAVIVRIKNISDEK